MSLETPKTTREHLEEAAARLIRADINPPVSTWQMVKRFFTGRVTPARIAIIAGAPLAVLRHEDGSVGLAEMPLTVRITSRMRDATNDDHAELVAQIGGDLGEAGALITRLNAIMAEDPAVSTFKVTYAEPDGEVESRVEEMRQITEIRVRVGIVPTEAVSTYEA